MDESQVGSYALGVANDSYAWYRNAATRSRRNHRISAVAVVVIAALIPVSAAVAQKNAVVPAVLGAVIVIVSGLRSTFNWQENYIRFSAAREAVEAQRRLYHTGAPPYDDVATRDQVLAAQITSLEQDEMASWLKIVTDGRPNRAARP